MGILKKSVLSEQRLQIIAGQEKPRGETMRFSPGTYPTIRLTVQNTVLLRLRLIDQ